MVFFKDSLDQHFCDGFNLSANGIRVSV
jgi:hypothetical protein